MTSRVLPVAEYPRLVGTELETVWPLLPADAQVLVVEDDGVIVGTWAFLRIVHAEGLWIAPGHRTGGAVARHLLRGLQTMGGAMQAPTVATAATGPAVARMLERIGAVLLPGSHYSMTIGEHHASSRSGTSDRRGGRRRELDRGRQDRE